MQKRVSSRLNQAKMLAHYRSLVCEDVLGTTCTWLVEAIGQHNHLRKNLDMIVDQVHKKNNLNFRFVGHGLKFRFSDRLYRID